MADAQAAKGFTARLRRRFGLAGAVLALAASGAGAAAAQAPGPQDPVAAGREIVERDCARCHAVGRLGESPLAQAPLFRDLHLHYDVEELAEALAEGIFAGHPAMPSRPFEPDEVRAVIAYLKSLEPPQGQAPAPRAP